MDKCKSSLNGHHLRAQRCYSGSHAGAALWAGGPGAGGPAPSPTVEMGVKQGIDMKVPATGPGHAGFSKAVRENLSPEGCTEASEELPVRSKSNWLPKHERTARVYPDKTEGQPQHLSFMASAQPQVLGAMSEPRDRKRQECSTTAETLVAHSAANTCATLGTNQVNASSLGFPPPGPDLHAEQGVTESWTDTQTPCAYPPWLLSNGR